MTDTNVLSQPLAAALLGVTPRRLRQMDKEDDPPPKNANGQYPAEEFGRWLKRRHVAGLGVTSDGTIIDYDQERARLTKEQADNAALRNALLRRTLAPIAALEWALGRAGAQISAILDTIPLKVKRRVPKLTASEVEIIKREVTKAQNMAARVVVDLDEYSADAGADGRDSESA